VAVVRAHADHVQQAEQLAVEAVVEPRERRHDGRRHQLRQIDLHRCASHSNLRLEFEFEVEVAVAGSWQLCERQEQIRD